MHRVTKFLIATTWQENRLAFVASLLVQCVAAVLVVIAAGLLLDPAIGETATNVVLLIPIAVYTVLMLPVARRAKRARSARPLDPPK